MIIDRWKKCSWREECALSSAWRWPSWPFWRKLISPVVAACCWCCSSLAPLSPLASCGCPAETVIFGPATRPRQLCSSPSFWSSTRRWWWEATGVTPSRRKSTSLPLFPSIWMSSASSSRFSKSSALQILESLHSYLSHSPDGNTDRSKLKFISNV